MNEYDVIVVGGGPAGTAAAKSAAKSGARTLLLERYPTIMANKPCGEATSQATLVTAGVSPRPGLIMHRAKALVYAPNMKSIEINEVGYCLNKSLFIQEIAADAAQAGADIRVREEVKQVFRKDNRMVVKTLKQEFFGRVVIGADGYNSTVKRSLGITEHSEPIPTVQYVMARCNVDHQDYVRFYLGNQIAPLGYAWIFPKGEGGIVEVGIGARGVVAKEYLDRFVKMFERELGKSQILDYRGAPVPIGGMIGQNVVDGTIIVGDAAGTVIPLTGAGIHSSVAAGLLAGEVAAHAVADGDTSKNRLSEFNERYGEHWGGRIRRSLKVMRALERLSDDELNILQEILGADDVLSLSNGLDIGKVVPKLLRHPILATKLAKALL